MKNSVDEHEWKTVLDSIENKMLSGALKPGTRLPSERAIASELGVKRSAVGDALRVLEALGLVNTRAGVSIGSAGMVVAAPAGGMGSLVRIQAAAQKFRARDILQIRLILEAETARDLAERRDTVDLGAVTQLLDAMDDPNLSKEEFAPLRSQFHSALAEAAGNRVVTEIMVGLRPFFEESSAQLTDVARDWDIEAASVGEEHRSVLDAIVVGDGDAAAERMRKHILGGSTEEAALHEPASNGQGTAPRTGAGSAIR